MVALVALVGLGELLLPESRAQVTGLHATQVPVGSSTLVCPEAGGAEVAVAAPGSRRGRLVLGPLGAGQGRRIASLDHAPARISTGVADGAGAVVASAVGGTAPGLEAEQYARSDSGSHRGIADVRCASPATSWWFAGVSTKVGDQARLYLSNVDANTATVDIVTYGRDGPVDPSAGRGISIDPGEREVVKLGEIAPDLRVSVVHVEVRTGRVAAALRTTVRDGSTRYGRSWVPPVQVMRRDVVVPAVPAGAGSRTLVLIAPGDEDAVASLRLSTPDGSFAPAGHDSVEVPARQAVMVDLGKVMAKSATAVQITSTVAVVAGLVAVEGGSGQDGAVAYSAGTPPLDGPAVLPVGASPDGGRATLQLTSPSRDSVVAVRTFGRSGPAGRTIRVKVAAGRTRQVRLTGSAGVVVTPGDGSGPVYASRVVTASPHAGPLMAVVPLTSGERQVDLPPVVPDVGAGVPR